MIYFVTCNGFVKIGYSSNPEERLNTIQTGNPYEVFLEATLDGGAGTEKEIQHFFSQYHHNREWFELKGDLLEFLEALKTGTTFPENTHKNLLDIILGDKYRCPRCKKQIGQNRTQTKVYCSNACKTAACRQRKETEATL